MYTLPIVVQRRLNRLCQPGVFQVSDGFRTYGGELTLMSSTQWPTIEQTFQSAWSFYVSGNMSAYMQVLNVIDNLVQQACAALFAEAVAELAAYNGAYAYRTWGWRPGWQPLPRYLAPYWTPGYSWAPPRGGEIGWSMPGSFPGWGGTWVDPGTGTVSDGPGGQVGDGTGGFPGNGGVVVTNPGGGWVDPGTGTVGDPGSGIPVGDGTGGFPGGGFPGGNPGGGTWVDPGTGSVGDIPGPGQGGVGDGTFPGQGGVGDGTFPGQGGPVLGDGTGGGQGGPVLGDGTGGGVGDGTQIGGGQVLGDGTVSG